MYKISNRVIPAALCMLLGCISGCGIVQPYLYFSDPAVSCIKTDDYSFFSTKPYGYPYVAIGSVNGNPAGLGPIYCFKPGKYKLGITGFTTGNPRPYTWSTTVEIEIKPNTKYWMRTSPENRYVFQLFDTTSSPQAMVLEFK